MVRHLVVAGLLAVLALAGPGAFAQTDASTASKEELMMLFQKQKSRGLKLAPNTAVSTATPETAGTPTTEVVSALPTVSEGAPVPVAYVELDKTEQINFRIGFDFDSAVLRDAEKPRLVALCEAMKAINGAFRIVGHTDAAGTDAYNEKLSLLRAEEVKRYLVSDCGVPEARLEAVGVGKRFLFNRDDPRSEENRRVEFQAQS